MSKRISLIIAIVLCVLLLSSCGKTEAEVKYISVAPTPMPTTSAGTPINEDFHPDVEMIDTPDSTCFSSIGWDASTGTLVVTFRDSGASYAYDEIPRSVWDGLRNADSMGGYYNKNIKGHYDCVKLG
jgi:hypothetical protein